MKGSFKGDIDVGVDVNVNYLGCLEEASKSVPVLLNGTSTYGTDVDTSKIAIPMVAFSENALQFQSPASCPEFQRSCT